MSSPKVVRWGAGAGVLGGRPVAGGGFLVLVNPGYWRFDSLSDYLVAAVEGAALLAVLGGLVRLHARQAGSTGAWGRSGSSRPSSGPCCPGSVTWAGSPSSSSRMSGWWFTC
ncbi:MAG: hypothetical protein M3Q60_08540 [Actinomycetota bacterium]|nr:hypothetical protein [Actinomycetota bacterium]